ncbi:hypothetical protein ACE1ET_02645 [Saccharicrinis sp. FJH62]|uniref:hypothetical protein n=1 Tax=Saccharicrinis sp. FJH62 TaxID=3344657 RepID=UPI0035D4689F
MTLKKQFLHPDIKETGLTKPRIIAGVVIGFLFALSLYGLLYGSREALRYYSVGWDSNIWILKDTEVWFYNLFFAFLSFIFGQSVCFLFWFYRPKRIYEKNRKRLSFINDQLNLNTFFMSWFAKLGFGFGLYYATECNYLTFSLIPKYEFLFVLIIIVLFLHPWMSIRRYFKNNSLKWMGISFLIISGLSLGLSFINILNYKSLNKTVLKRNIPYTYHLELPETWYHVTDEKNRTYVDNIYLIKDSVQSDSQLFYNELEIDLSELSKILKEKAEADRTFQFQYLQLSIDKKISMGYITQLIDNITKSGIYRLGFRILPKDRIFDDKYYFKEFFPLKAMPTDSIYLQHLQTEKRSISNTINVKMIDNGDYEINNVGIPASGLKSYLSEEILKNTDYVVSILINDRSSYNSFMKIYDSVYQIIYEKRNEMSSLKYGEDFQYLDEEQMDSIRTVYPIRIDYLTTKIQNQMVGQ